MENREDKRSEKILIIGFTGPIGSGCTELSNFLSKNDKFWEFLVESKFISNKSDSKFKEDIVDDSVVNTFEKKAEIEKEVEKLQIATSELPNIESINELSFKREEVKISHRDLREYLEKRNYLHSLEPLLKGNFYENKLRISCSSIIVFELIRNLDSTISGGQKVKVQSFKDLIIKILDKHSISKDFAQNVFSPLKNLFDHKEQIQNIDKKLVPKCFENIAKIKKDLKSDILYRELMQDFGDNLRATGNPYYYASSEWINDNKVEFQLHNKRIGRYIDYLIHYYSQEEDTRLFYIDSLRNPMCINYLRNRYSNFYLISVFASLYERKKRIKKQMGSNFDEFSFLTHDKRDQGKDFKNKYDGFYKQNVRESAIISDIAINNDNEFHYKSLGGVDKQQSEIFEKLLRYIALVISPGCTKPTIQEMFMNTAFTVAMKSNCISRKVGAVIAGKHGYLIGAGWNDVGEGQISCGLRKIKDLRLPEYSNCIEAFKKKGGNDDLTEEEVIENLVKEYGNENSCFCLKDELSKIELKSKLESIYDQNTVESHGDGDTFYNKVKTQLKVKKLEYCKALHAEENAIIQGSKIGGMGLKNSKIYITTYPCELCAKKIQQAGISEIVYVEPYPKVLSEDLYLKEGVRKVGIKQFEGVKAYSYMKLFKSFLDQKEKQVLVHNEFSNNIV